jgi:hypothetical protein
LEYSNMHRVQSKGFVGRVSVNGSTDGGSGEEGEKGIG